MAFRKFVAPFLSPPPIFVNIISKIARTVTLYQSLQLTKQAIRFFVIYSVSPLRFLNWASWLRQLRFDLVTETVKLKSAELRLFLGFHSFLYSM
jgi:hypothetical protein